MTYASAVCGFHVFRVLKLEAEDAALEAAYKAAQAGLSAAESLTNSVLDGIDFATTAATSLFNIENMWISAGSVASVKYVSSRALVRGEVSELSCDCVVSAGAGPSCRLVLQESSSETTSTGHSAWISLRSSTISWRPA